MPTESGPASGGNPVLDFFHRGASHHPPCAARARFFQRRPLVESCPITCCGFALVALFVAGLQAEGAPQNASVIGIEVASVKHNVSGRSDASFKVQPDGFVATNLPLNFLIARAYGIEVSRLAGDLLGGDRRVLEARFDVQAKTTGPIRAEEVSPVLQRLLAERFQLKVEREQRRRSVFALAAVARRNGFGPEMRRSQTDCAAVRAELRSRGVLPIETPPPRDAKGRSICWLSSLEERSPAGVWRTRSAGSIAALISEIQGFVDRPIVDHTGIDGLVEWQLEFNPKQMAVSTDGAPQLFAALTEQLGLKLTPDALPAEVFVVKSVMMPTPN
jgi:uncharacterized protein (TIGR03435 family)